MPETKITAAFTKNKNEFISWCSERSLIISAIKRLERKIAAETPPPGCNRWVISENTNEKLSRYSIISCVCVINPKTGDIAPCWLFLPLDRVKEPLPAQEIRAQIETVLNELGWD